MVVVLSVLGLSPLLGSPLVLPLFLALLTSAICVMTAAFFYRLCKLKVRVYNLRSGDCIAAECFRFQMDPITRFGKKKALRVITLEAGD